MTWKLLVFVVLLAFVARAEGSGTIKGTPDIKSAGPLAFGPKGVLFVGDPVAGAIFAIETGDLVSDPVGSKFYASDFDKQVMAAVGEEDRVFGRFNDMAINPASGKAYLSFDRGIVRKSIPTLIRIDSTGKVEVVPLRDVTFTKISVPHPAPVEPPRPGPNFYGLSVTDLVFVDGLLYVAGLSGDKFDSRIIPIPYPFPEKADEGTTVEIFHSPTGVFNATLPIYTLAPCRLKGMPHFLAAYSQTPLVTIPVAEIKPNGQFRAPTVADLGNRNNPLDSLVYRNGEKEFVIITNTRQGMFKISLDWIAGAAPITSRFVGPGGLPLEKIAELKGISLIDRIDDDHALVLGHKSKGGVDLFAIPLP